MKELLPAIGKRALPSGIGLAQDILSGENVLKSAKSRLIEAGKNVADETLDKIKSRVQKGTGYRKRRRKNKKVLASLPIIIKRKRKVNKKVKTKKRLPKYLR